MRPDTAYYFVSEAVNDYAGERGRRALMRAGEPADEELFDAFAELNAHARLPEPSWLVERHTEEKAASLSGKASAFRQTG